MKKYEYDYIVIGSGPAGLQLAYDFQKNNKDYIVLERSDCAGSFFKKYPRHRKLISINKVYTGFDDPEINLRWDWNSLLTDDSKILFTDYDHSYFPSADSMVKYLNDYKNIYSINVEYNCEVVLIKKVGEKFSLINKNGETYFCKQLIVATGYDSECDVSFEGEYHADKYSEMSLDLQDYKNKRVMVVGKGNSAFETADYFSEVTKSIFLVSPNSLKLAWENHYVGSLRAVNNNLIDTYQLKSQNAIIDGHVEKITKEEKTLVVRICHAHARESKIDIPVDKVILCTGFKFNDSLFDSTLKPETTFNGKFPKLTHEWESTNIKGLYFAGTLMHGNDYKKTFSGFIHGFRYNVRALYNILVKNNEGVELPNILIKRNGNDFCRFVLNRVHKTSSLFQQPGYLCDVADLSDKKIIKYYKDLTKDYVTINSKKLGLNQYVLISIEYGKTDHPNPFSVPRDPSDGSSSVFVHPVLRYYVKGNLVHEYHIPEDLENNWYQDFYLRPFLEFIHSRLELFCDYNTINKTPIFETYINGTRVVE